MKKSKKPVLLFLLPALSAVLAAAIDNIFNAAAMVISYFLFLAAALIISALTKKISIAWFISTGTGLVLSFINYCKLTINGTPLTLNDFAMAKSLNEVAGFALSQIKPSPAVILAFMAFIAVSVLLIFIEGNFRPINRIISLSAGAAILLVLFLPLTGASLAEAMQISGNSPEELSVRFGTVSGLYLSNAQDNAFHLGHNPDSLKSELAGLEALSQSKTDTNPTVIFLMSESFFDVDRLENVSFSKDPIPNFHSLEKSFSAGSFVSSTYCGGTGYVEMEVLTGLCSYFLKNSDDLTSLPNETYLSVPSISDIFLNRGYELTFLHSYNSELYNRPAIYNALGFKNILFEDNFPKDADRAGGYISDAAFTDEIIRHYEAKGDKPMMLYGISMENHQPFFDGKFSEKSEIEIESDRLTQEEKGVFDAYIHGLADADKALGRLISYFEQVNEPVMIVFFGDHLPNLNIKSGGSVYESLGYSKGGNTALWEAEDLLKMVSTDYVIWDNFDLEKKDKTLGSSMLGLEIANRLGFGLTDYYSWLDSTLADSYIMYRSRLFMPNEHEVYSSVPAEYADIMQDYSNAVYDIVYGKRELFRSYR